MCRTMAVLAVFFCMLASATAEAPLEYERQFAKQLDIAGENRGELLLAIREVPAEHRDALKFLIANMPQRDLKSLSKDYLLTNIRYAYLARAEAPWGKDIPEELFLNNVLPYANANERRDDWRKDFYKRFMPVAKQCKTSGEAAVRLNKEVFEQLKVKYHPTKRPKPDQSPYESTEAGFASCTGLSIMLVDACRAVCIPGRIVGTPRWTEKVGNAGNHTWTEIWDRQWHFVGSAEPSPLNRTWFNAVAAKADPTKVEHRIYAASFARTPTWFPLVWDLNILYVTADDVTAFYTTRCKVTFSVVDCQGGRPVKSQITVRLGGRLVAADTVDGSAEFVLAGLQTYQVHVQSTDGSDEVKREISLTDRKDQTVEIALDK